MEAGRELKAGSSGKCIRRSLAIPCSPINAIGGNTGLEMHHCGFIASAKSNLRKHTLPTHSYVFLVVSECNFHVQAKIYFSIDNKMDGFP